MIGGAAGPEVGPAPPASAGDAVGRVTRAAR